MLSQITRSLTKYKKALDDSQARYESLHICQSKNSEVFYNTFFKKLIRDYSSKFTDTAVKGLFKKSIEQNFKNQDY